MTKTFVKAAVIALFSATALVSTASANDKLPLYMTEAPKPGTPVATFNSSLTALGDAAAEDSDEDIAQQVADLFDEIANVRFSATAGGISGNDRARGDIVVLARKVKAMQSDAVTQQYPEDIVQALASAEMRVKDIQEQIDLGYEKLKDERAEKLKKADLDIGTVLRNSSLTQDMVDMALSHSMTNLGQIPSGGLGSGLGGLPPLEDKASGRRDF